MAQNVYITLPGSQVQTSFCCSSGFLKASLFISLLILYLVYYSNSSDTECQIELVESIPLGLNYTPGSPKFLSTYEAWSWLLDNAKSNIDIGSFYWTMRGVDVVRHPSAKQGEDIFDRLLANGNASSKYKLQIRIAQSEPTTKEPDIDTQLLQNGAAEVVSVDFSKYLGSGVLHTKLWVVDNKHFYIGSANMDWRALTQVKEMGVLAKNCPVMAKDVNKIFEAYWYLGSNPNKPIPKNWPAEYETKYNQENPLTMTFKGNVTMNTYFSSSPPPLTANGRTNDMDAILSIIDNAQSYVNIAVMDYYPLIIYEGKPIFWPFIDNALRRAAINRKVSVKLLISWWKHSNPMEDFYLRSLQDLSNASKDVDVQIRRFIVPEDADQEKIPFSRVNHNKYMVTERTAYIGTSNWSGDYFTDTAGIGLVLQNAMGVKQEKTLRMDLLSVFERDWHSPYAKKFHEDKIENKNKK